MVYHGEKFLHIGAVTILNNSMEAYKLRHNFNDKIHYEKFYDDVDSIAR